MTATCGHIKEENRIMKKQKIPAMTYVMNRKTGKAYLVVTDTVQSRGRRQCEGTGLNNPEIIQICESSLVPINKMSARICQEAERIIRGKHKRTMSDYQTLYLWNAIKSAVMA